MNEVVDKKITPWDFINSLHSKNYIIDDENTKEYAPWITNKSLGSFSELIFMVNEMNTHHHIDNRMQYDFYFYGIPKGKRFKKWIKKEKSLEYKYIEELAKRLNCSLANAETYWNLLNADQKNEIITKFFDVEFKNSKVYNGEK
jgi:hypothetical protein